MGDFTNLEINQEVVFLTFLPPLLYEAAWQISWQEFWIWRRVIASFAFSRFSATCKAPSG